MSNISRKPETPEDPWKAVTWEGNERLQLRRMRELSLREKMLAIESLGEVTELMRLTAARRQSAAKTSS